MKFEIDEETKIKISAWLLDEIYPTIIAEQKASSKEAGYVSEVMQSCWDAGYPYAGAVGGGVDYIFGPCGLGVKLTVRAWGHDKDFTDYDSW